MDGEAQLRKAECRKATVLIQNKDSRRIVAFSRDDNSNFPAAKSVIFSECLQ